MLFDFSKLKIKALKKVHKSFLTCKCDAMYMLFKKTCSLEYKKINLKVLTCFCMI